jgi:hypothetical protein
MEGFPLLGRDTDISLRTGGYSYTLYIHERINLRDLLVFSFATREGLKGAGGMGVWGEGGGGMEYRDLGRDGNGGVIINLHSTLQ